MRPTAVRTPVLIAVVLLLLAACGDDTTGPGAEPAPTLDGRTFVGDQVTGHDLVADSSLTMSFEDGKANVNAGCNQLFGDAQLDNGVLVVSQMGGTEMGCPPELMDQDTWIVEFLQSGPEVTVDDKQLVLTKNGTTITLDDEAQVQADNPIPLEGTTWELDAILKGSGDDGSVSSVPGETPTLVIQDGQIQVFTGCNSGTASVGVTDTTMTIGPLPLTRMFCEISAEPEVVAVLEGEVEYTQDYDTLTLTSPDGNSGLQFRAR
jgi:heat shock protein HslJ